MTSLEVLFTPADFAALAQRDLSATVCVVFDVLRATTTMVTALANGAAAIIPVQEIADALAVRQRQPDVLLAGEREGVRIGPELANGVGFDLGNSPREFVRSAVAGKTIVMTTTNGTRALRACQRAQITFAGSFLNLTLTAEAIQKAMASEVLVVCSGTFDQASYEDVLGAGALCDRLWGAFVTNQIADSAHMARELFLAARPDLAAHLSRARNARRLLSRPDLREDVAFSLQQDVSPLLAVLGENGRITSQNPL